jgi:tetratricopeptide (TPR) repeat protein
VCLLLVSGSVSTRSAQTSQLGTQPARSGADSSARAPDNAHSDDAQPGHYLGLGVLARKSGKLDLARSYVLRAIQLDPRSAEAYEQLGIDQSERQEWSDALSAMKRAVELAPKNSQYHYNLAALQFKRHAYPDARAEFHRALDLEPKNPDYRFAYASTFEAEDNLPQAHTELAAMLAQFPEKERAQYSLASVLYRQGDLKGASEHVKRALQLEPGDADADYLLAKIRESEGQLSSALDSALQVVKLQPTHLNAHHLLSVLYTRLGKTKQAAQERAVFTSLKLKIDAANFVVLGTEYLRNGNYDLAEENFGRAVASDPQNLQARYQLALTWQQKQEYTKAINAYQEVLSLNPRIAVVHAELGLLLATMGRKAEAEPQLEQAVGLDQDSFRVSLTTGRAYLILADYSRAEASLLRAQQLFPSQPTVLINLFNVYQRWEKASPARQYAKLAADADPQDGALLGQTGAFWLQQRSFGQARRDLERAIALDPNDSSSHLNLAWARFYLRDYAAARLALDRHLELTPTSGEGRYLSAMLFVQSGDPQRALDQARQASQLSPHDQRVFLLLARVCDRLGRKEEAASARRQSQQPAVPTAVN